MKKTNIESASELDALFASVTVVQRKMVWNEFRALPDRARY